MALTNSYLNQYPRGPGGIQRNPIYPRGPGGVQQYSKGPGSYTYPPTMVSNPMPYQPPMTTNPMPYQPPPPMTAFPTYPGPGTNTGYGGIPGNTSGYGYGTVPNYQPPMTVNPMPFYPPNQYRRPNVGGQWQGRLPQQFQQPNYSNMPYFLQQLLGLVR